MGYLLRAEAAKQGVVVTSDAGDQHGVLARMMEEIEMWGFDIVQAGNMKGFLNRHQNLEGIAPIAKQLKLSTVQCLAYTDGSKLNIEMSVIANEYGLTPFVPGMEGPRANKVQDVVDPLRLRQIQRPGPRGLRPRCKGARRRRVRRRQVRERVSAGLPELLQGHNKHPYYVFLRPYHLCHLETPRAVALAALYGKAVCTMRHGRVSDTFAYAKKDNPKGTHVQHAIGGDEVYGLIDEAKMADAATMCRRVCSTSRASRSVQSSSVRSKDDPITWDDIDIPENRMVELWEQQKPHIGLK